MSQVMKHSKTHFTFVSCCLSLRNEDYGSAAAVDSTHRQEENVKKYDSFFLFCYISQETMFPNDFSLSAVDNCDFLYAKTFTILKKKKKMKEEEADYDEDDYEEEEEGRRRQ